MTDSKAVLKITLVDDGTAVLLEVLDAERFTHYGFGTFLENIAPGEITIDSETVTAILACPERSGLQGLELWKDNRLAWGARVQKIQVALEDIDTMPGCEKWLVANE